ncbi:MAG: hypothetical protein ABIW57_00245 [Polyangia bacterium]
MMFPTVPGIDDLGPDGAGAGDAPSGLAPLSRACSLAAAAWTAGVGLAFVFGVAKRLVWHLFG